RVMNRTLQIACALMVVSATARAQNTSKATQDRADSLYRVGRTAIDNRDYRRAETVLKQVVDRYPLADRAAESLYWRSWALYQLGTTTSNRGDLDDALAVIERYNTNYGKNAKMASDATDLYGRIRTAQAQLGDARAAGEVVQRADAQGRPQAARRLSYGAPEARRVSHLAEAVSRRRVDAARRRAQRPQFGRAGRRDLLAVSDEKRAGDSRDRFGPLLVG